MFSAFASAVAEKTTAAAKSMASPAIEAKNAVVAAYRGDLKEAGQHAASVAFRSKSLRPSGKTNDISVPPLGIDAPCLLILHRHVQNINGLASAGWAWRFSSLQVLQVPDKER